MTRFGKDCFQAVVVLEKGDRLPMMHSTKGSFAGPGVVILTDNYGDGAVKTTNLGAREDAHRESDDLPSELTAFFAQQYAAAR